ncbi:hypothetical protein FH972_021737 [Carpinus fangiana]|uniref:Uncharacterized protein n=1 Tax=Carpinus fangiana TaxID=176857 RepID=A0A5N6KQ59_9ROSI|nr:hypothetical protein FH972_021737 [Carpinus fangiana]
MTTTPPPPVRARTPPTPLHGAKHDAFEPFSPRRSGRINNRLSPLHNVHSSSKSLTSTPRHKPACHRTSSQTFSPPPSPGSPAQRRRIDTAGDSASRKRAKPSIFVDHPGSDDELVRDFASSRSKAMLPTPAKTPRKRNAQANAGITSTARVLFPGRTMHPDDVVPSPKKSRKNSKKAAFSLESFADACENGGERIEIYTDSKERIPEMDESEDNPFITRGAPRGSRSRPARKTKNGMSRKVDEAVDNEEGMVYVFRGKKVFRRFDASADDSMDDLGEEDEMVNERDVRRTARGASQKRFTRSTIKPRLLFPPKASDPTMDEEEAATDIEDELAMATPQPEEPLDSTPRKQAYRLTTPPTTVRKNRRGAALTPDSSPIAAPAESYADELAQTESAPAQPAKRSPFDSWQRTKSHTRTVSGKRNGESMEKQESPKRSRSGNY